MTCRIATALLAAFVLLLPGCGAEDQKLDYPERELRLPDLAHAGSVSGTIRFVGEAPERRRLQAPAAACGHGPILDETVIVTDGKLADVLVYIESGAEGYVFPWQKEEALIDQQGCRFEPHVLAIRARQPIRVKNSDPLAHNINVGSKLQEGFLVSLPGPGSVLRQLTKPELSIHATCDLHANMLMHIHVLDHPWFVVTGRDGRFSIPELPPGTYRLAARHMELGEQSKPLVIGADGKVEDFDFEFAR